MLALPTSQEKNASRCAPNILPCRIHHNGPVKVTKRFWSPCTESDGSRTAYFRGRRLRGRAVKLPAGYQGIVVKSCDRTLPIQSSTSIRKAKFDDEMTILSEEEEEEEQEPVKVLDTAASFEEIVVWGHDQLPTADDTFVKGVEEWISFAEAIHLPKVIEAKDDKECS